MPPILRNRGGRPVYLRQRTAETEIPRRRATCFSSRSPALDITDLRGDQVSERASPLRATDKPSGGQAFLTRPFVCPVGEKYGLPTSPGPPCLPQGFRGYSPRRLRFLRGHPNPRWPAQPLGSKYRLPVNAEQSSAVIQGAVFRCRKTTMTAHQFNHYRRSLSRLSITESRRSISSAKGRLRRS